MSPRPLLPLLLVLTGCSRSPDAAALLTEARQRLAARDGKLTSYVLEGTAREAGQSLSFQFAYRAPQKMLGTLGPPTRRTWAWDGTHLIERDDAARTFSTFEEPPTPERRVSALTALFTPFVPEGYRAPLLPGQGVSARRASHPLAPEALELTVKPAGSDVEVVYVLRWPGMDFLAKRMRSGQDTSELRVEAEQCEATLGLCVPRRLTQWTAGQPVAETELTRVELNPTLPADTFAPPPPPDYTVGRKTFAEEQAH
jgi:hypothetical protein